MKSEFFQEIQLFVGFGEEDARLLRKLFLWLPPKLDGLADSFYSTIQKYPEARKVLRDQAQVERLKETLKAWALKLCSGPYDEEYLRLRARIGRVHVQIGLPQRYMLTGMSIIWQYLARVVEENASSLEEERSVNLALRRILDCELAIMLQTYHEDLLGKLGRHERLAALGAVAVTVNHELKNPLGVLKTSVDALRRQLALSSEPPGDDRVKRHLEKLDRNLNKMQRNITSLLEFARYSEPKLEETDIHTVLDEAMEEVSVPTGVEVKKMYDRAIPRLTLDPAQIASVFVNLATNAFEVMEGKGTLTLETRGLPAGVRVTISDTGPGVPPELREQIFEPLWTGRPGGTGMGLAICRNLVEAHRGRIWVESDACGARFHVELPSRGESF